MEVVVLRSSAELRVLAIDILEANGATSENAQCVADHLVLANLSGVDTHGVLQLTRYVERIRGHDLDPAALPGVIRETATSALVSGHWGFGQPAATLAMSIGVTKAQREGMAVVGLVEAGHIGRLGHYVEVAAASGMVAMIWAGGYGVERPVALPYGGRDRVLHTNPMAFGSPSGGSDPLTFDFATSSVSGTTVAEARRRKTPVPPGSIVDSQGQPTTNPEDYFDGGGLLPFGGHKGYALMVAAELMGRVFTGAAAFAGGVHEGHLFRYQGVTMIVVRANLFQASENYSTQGRELLARIRGSRPAPGFEAVLAPGDPESASRRERERQGIPIDDDLWADLVRLSIADPASVTP